MGDGLAARHLRNAVELDEDYGEALSMLGLLAERAGHKKLAEQYFRKAGAGTVFRRSAGAKRTQRNSVESPAPLFRVSAANARKLITGGDRRLAEALRQDALNACSAYSDPR